MAKIFYSMAGEGRGHASRVRAMVEALRRRHELVLLAPDEAYDFLAPQYPAGSPGVEVRRIPGLRFHYTQGRLDLTRSVRCGLEYLRKLPRLVEELRRAIRDESPALAITDFEPALPRAARAAGLPLVSLSHQQFLVACDLSSLPLSLRAFASLMSLVVRAHVPHADQSIISSFFRCPLRWRHRTAIQVGPLLRPELKRLTATPGDYLLSYLRKNSPPRVLEVLASGGREVRVYGLGPRPAAGPLRFCALDERTFAEDLAGCAAVVGAAGNQTLGEALYLGKPVLALPEARHHEQLINAHFLKQMRVGTWTTLEAFQSRDLARFLDRQSEFLAGVWHHRGRLDGTQEALAVIERWLPRLPSDCREALPCEAIA